MNTSRLEWSYLFVSRSPCKSKNRLNISLQHILNVDLRTISNYKLGKPVSKGPKYNEPVNTCYQEAKTQIFIGLKE